MLAVAACTHSENASLRRLVGARGGSNDGKRHPSRQVGAAGIGVLLQEAALRALVAEVAPCSFMQASKAASDRPVSAADVLLVLPDDRDDERSRSIATGTNVPNTIAAVEIFLGGFGGGVGHHAGSEKSVPHQHGLCQLGTPDVLRDNAGVEALLTA